MTSNQQHREGPNTVDHLGHPSRPVRQLGRVVPVPAKIPLARLVAVSNARTAKPPAHKREVAHAPNGRHGGQDGRHVPPDPAAGALPLERREPDRRVDQANIKNQPEGEARRLEGRLAHVEGVDHLPRDVEGEPQERHAVGPGAEAAERHEDVRRVPEQHADAERDRRQRHDPARDVGRGHVAGAHVSDVRWVVVDAGSRGGDPRGLVCCLAQACGWLGVTVLGGNEV